MRLSDGNRSGYRKKVPVYPDLWSNERWIKDPNFGTKFTGTATSLQDLKNEGIIGSGDNQELGSQVICPFITDAFIEYSLGLIVPTTCKVFDMVVKKLKDAAAAATVAGEAVEAAAEIVETVGCRFHSKTDPPLSRHYTINGYNNQPSFSVNLSFIR